MYLTLVWLLLCSWPPEPPANGVHSPVCQRLVTFFHPVHPYGALRQESWKYHQVCLLAWPSPLCLLYLLDEDTGTWKLSHLDSRTPSPLLSASWSNQLFHNLFPVVLPCTLTLHFYLNQLFCYCIWALLQIALWFLNHIANLLLLSRVILL